MDITTDNKKSVDKKGDIPSEVKLEKVLGLTVSNNSAFDCDPNSSIVAYPAGCVIVIYNVRKNKQGHILSSSKKTITSLAFSSDGKYLATGECGHQPHVRVWDVQEKIQVAEFQGHKYGINCVAFSPNLKYVVSVGSQHDMIVNVWDWKNNVKVASNKVSCKVKALSFASNGNYFVTVGNRHVKFWYLEYSRSTKYKLEPVPLMGRSAILGDQRNNYFCDVSCGKGEMVDSTYAITKSGLLCEFNSRRLLDKWVELRTTSANSISVGENLIFIGCAEGVIRCFSPFNLSFISTLPKPHPLGVDVSKGLIGGYVCGIIKNSCTGLRKKRLILFSLDDNFWRKSLSHQSNVKFPDTIAVALDEMNKKVTCVYNDHSLYVWDIKDTKKVGKSHSFMYHSACIWGIEIYPEMPEGSKIILPKGTFLTCSSDDTIRFWNLESSIEQDTSYHRNIYSSELLKILYIDSELSYLCDTDLNANGSNDKVDTTYDGKNGVRCLRISPDGRHLASGDRSGNIRIHDLEFVEELCKIEAHDSEVLCLEYSKPIIVAGHEKKYLASASRDRLIHVFDVKQDYTFQQTLDDHSSSITAVRFVQNGGALQMISCGADKSIIFRKAAFNPQLALIREHHVVGKTTLYDMEVDLQQRHILTACQDRNIRVYSVTNGKHGRCFRGSQGEDGTLIKVVLDSSGTYLATSCTDKSLYLYDYTTGECLATMFGHSELVTGLKFTNDGRHLISVSGDGCIFMWKLPVDVTQTMLSKQLVVEGSGLPSLWQDNRRNIVAITKPLQLVENDSEDKPSEENDLVTTEIDTPPGYRFSVGQLPLWAKKQMLEKLPDTPNSNQNLPPPIPPRGRWAQRVDGQGLVVRSYLDGDSVIPYPNVAEESENSSRVHSETIVTNGQNQILETKDIEFEVSEQSLKEILNGSLLNDVSSQIPLRPSSTGNLNNNNRRSRPLSNPHDVRLEEIDAEDERSDSEISEMVYYPASEDGSDVVEGTFHVCAGNGVNAKDSSKQSLKPKPERLLSEAPSVNTPEHETNSDDEDASTPVDSEQSFLSSLCISTENLERLGQREKFMKSNYESLEKGGNLDTHHNEIEDRNFFRQSISAKFLAGSLVPSKRLLSNGTSKSPLPERQLSTPTKKREELLKALNDAKKKLETVGYRSGLSSSKSIADLHSTPDREMFKSPKYRTPDGDIRRAASMTDLSLNADKQRLFSTPNSKGGDEPAAPLWNHSRIYPINISPSTSPKPEETRLPQTPKKSDFPETGTVARSTSASSLYHKSPAATSSLHKTSSVYALDRASPQRFGRANLLPKNQFNATGRANLPSLPQRHQSASLITTAPLATDSSSDSSPNESPPIKNGRQTAPPRQFGTRSRNFSLSESMNSGEIKGQLSSEGLQKFRLKSRSEWDLKNSCQDDYGKSKDSWQSSRYLSYSPRKNYMRPLKLNHIASSSPSISSTDNLRHSESSKDLTYSEQFPYMSWDAAAVPLTPEVCENIADNLNRVATFAMQVFQRLTATTDLPPNEKSVMVNILAQGVWQAQQNLRPAVPRMNQWPNSIENFSDFNSQRLPGLNFPHANGDIGDSSLRLPNCAPQQPDVFNSFLQQFSDKLLSLMEQKISNSQDKPNN